MDSIPGRGRVPSGDRVAPNKKKSWRKSVRLLPADVWCPWEDGPSPRNRRHASLGHVGCWRWLQRAAWAYIITRGPADMKRSTLCFFWSLARRGRHGATHELPTFTGRPRRLLGGNPWQHRDTVVWGFWVFRFVTGALIIRAAGWMAVKLTSRSVVR